MNQLRGTLRHYCTALRRWHRSRGFGIHSPFAYRFVSETLRGRPRNRYDYAPLVRLCAGRDAAGPLRHILRRLYRIVAHLRPSHVTVIGHDPQHLMTDTAALIPGGTAARPMLIVTSPPVDTRLLSRTLADEGIIYFTDLRDSELRRAYDTLRTDTTHVMSFTNDREAIMVSRHDLPKQEYRIWLKGH